MEHNMHCLGSDVPLGKELLRQLTNTFASVAAWEFSDGQNELHTAPPLSDPVRSEAEIAISIIK